jgi:hypothetical protein
MSQDFIEEFNEIYKLYNQGIYTDAEVISRSIELLGTGNTELWTVFPAEVKNGIRKQLDSFSEEDELVYFGHENVDAMKKKLLLVKAWLAEQN